MSTELAVIQGHIRQAVAHERAAFSHKDKYEQQMKAAGAEWWTAFGMTVRNQPEYQGRQIDEKALNRIFTDRKSKPFWEKVIATVPSVKAKNKAEYAARAIQWHREPEAAASRRDEHNRLEKQRYKSTDGANAPSVGRTEPTRADWKALSEELSESTMVDTRPAALPVSSESILHSDALVALDAALNRIRGYASKAPTAAIEAATDDLQSIGNDLAEEVRQAANARFG